MSESVTPESESSALSVWDAVSLIIGIVIGSTVYKSAGLIAASLPDPWTCLGFWVLGGGLSFVGALCYAELATTYPRLGGEYNFLTHAFGPACGFLFGWSQLAIIQTGSIGALSYVFAEYAAIVFGLPKATSVWLAVLAVVVLTGLNCLGIQAGKRTQNLLSVTKGLGLLLLIFAGLSAAGSTSLAVEKPAGGGGWSLALILILYAYGGWNDAAFVAADLRDRTRNIPRALIFGIGITTFSYVLINAAYLATLGFEGLRSSGQPASDAMKQVFGVSGERLISVLVMVSALGSVNGVVFSVARLHATVGADHPVFAYLGHWSPTTSAPLRSLLVQGLISSALILGVGTPTGRTGIDSGLRLLGVPAVPWDHYFGGFDTLYAASAPIFWLFFSLSAISYFVLYFKDRNRERPFRAPWFPLCPLLFTGMCLFGLYSSVMYAWPLLPLIAGPFLLGLPLYGVSEWLRRRSPGSP